MKMTETEIAELYTVIYDSDTGELFLKFKVVDPVWRQKILREWEDYRFKLIIEDEDGTKL